MAETEQRAVPVARAEPPAGTVPATNKTAAVLICETAPDVPAVASLSTLDRLLVAVHRAGCDPILVVSHGALPPLRRAPSLEISYQTAATLPALHGPAFVASTRILLTVRDVQRLIETKSRLAIDGRPAPAGF